MVKFMIGDSLTFDFGRARLVQKYFRNLGGVKVVVGARILYECALC